MTSKPIEVSVEIKGFEELNRKLKKLSGKEAKAVIRKSSRKTLKALLPRMKANTPSMTGDLEETFRIRATKRSRSSTGAQIQFGGDWQFYGAFLELGTKERFHDQPPKSVGAIPDEYPLGGLGFARGTALMHKKGTQRLFGFYVGAELESLARRG